MTTLTRSLIRAVDPTAEPVTLAEAKRWLAVDASDKDDLIASLIAGARERVEKDTQRSLMTQTWRLKLDEWPADAMELMRSPVQSVTSVQYLDSGGATQTVASGDYDVDTDSNPGAIRLGVGKTWPTTQAVMRAITVTYVTGYGATAAAVPAALLWAVRLQLELMFEMGFWLDDRAKRESYDALVNQYRVGVWP